jgi:tRNA (guanine26-N2/guanine27-N2)-dimethyltransferase
MKLVDIKEGKTIIAVPVQDTAVNFPPGTAPVFFNRKMELNRDATVLIASVLQPSNYLDAMGATGIRGLRIAGECSIPVTINDRDKKAIALIRKNVKATGLPAEITNRDANALLSERAFDAVDLDPFGTPAPFTDAGVRGCRRFLFVTATDTAPLCGAHLKAGIRRYGAIPMNTEYHSEVGLRILLGFVVRETVKYDRGIEPLFCFARQHFVRLHLKLARGAVAADRALKRMGYILQCTKCQYREESPGLVLQGSVSCPLCGSALQPIGPLYLGAIRDDETLDRMAAALGDFEMGTKKELASILALCREELPISSFYDYHRIAKSLKVSPPDIATVIGRIRSAGHLASRTHFSGYGIKTDAPVDELKNAISAR